MAFNAQQNVAVGGFRDTTAPLRSVVSGVQGRMQQDELLAAKLRQQEIDNAYRANQAKATADYRAGMTKRADAQEARQADIYNIAKADKAATELASGLYSDVGTTTGMTKEGMKDPISAAQGAITQGDTYKAMEKDLISQSEDVATINARVKEMEAEHKKKYGGAPGMRRSREEYAAENASKSNIDLLKGQAEARQKLVDEGAAKYTKAYDTDSNLIADSIAEQNAIKAKSKTQYAKDLKEDLATQARAAKGGKKLTKAEDSAIDRRVKGYVDTYAAVATDKTTEEKRRAALTATERIKGEADVKYTNSKKDPHGKEAQSKRESLEALALVNRVNSSMFADDDNPDYLKALDKVKAAGLEDKIKDRPWFTPNQ